MGHKVFLEGDHIGITRLSYKKLGTPNTQGDVLLRRSLNGRETLIARYVRATRPDGTVANVWYLSPRLSAADRAYYRGLIQQAAARVAAAGG